MEQWPLGSTRPGHLLQSSLRWHRHPDGANVEAHICSYFGSREAWLRAVAFGCSCTSEAWTAGCSWAILILHPRYLGCLGCPSCRSPHHRLRPQRQRPRARRLHQLRLSLLPLLPIWQPLAQAQWPLRLAPGESPLGRGSPCAAQAEELACVRLGRSWTPASMAWRRFP